MKKFGFTAAVLGLILAWGGSGQAKTTTTVSTGSSVVIGFGGKELRELRPVFALPIVEHYNTGEVSTFDSMGLGIAYGKFALIYAMSYTYIYSSDDGTYKHFFSKGGLAYQLDDQISLAITQDFNGSYKDQEGSIGIWWTPRGTPIAEWWD